VTNFNHTHHIVTLIIIDTISQPPTKEIVFMQARQALFGSAPSAEHLKIYTEFLTNCQELFSEKIQSLRGV
jgi:hypothetical protein